MKLEDAKRIVIKIGSALLVDDKTGLLKEDWLLSLAEDVAGLRKSGKEVIIVSSGAVALGRKYLGISRAELRLEEKQAAASCGQVELLRYFRKAFEVHDIKTSQVLMTIDDTEDRRRFLNAKNTIETLLGIGVVPVINENDTVATAEIRFGDNDRLAAKVSQMAIADVLVLLSDIDGLYTMNPKLDEGATFIEEVKQVTPEIEAMAGGSLSHVGSGGMETKVAAAKIAMLGGAHMVITDGNEAHPVQRLLDGARATWFLSHETPLTARKHWIATAIDVRGDIIVDKGAVKALKAGTTSLLPVGVVDVVGDFERGDAVIIKDHNVQEIGRGLVAYSSVDARLIMGQQSSEIENIVGFSGRDELIHKDDLVLTV